MSEPHREAQNLCAEAQAAPTSQTRTGALTTLLELVLNKHPFLLHDYFLFFLSPELLDFASPADQVKQKFWLLGMVETVCKRCLEYLPKSLPVVTQLLQDPEIEVSKRAVRCYSQIFPHAMLLLANACFISSEIFSLHNGIKATNKMIFDFIAEDRNKAISVQAIRFVEVFILTQSLPADVESVIFSPAVVPPHHSLITSDDLIRQANGVINFCGGKLFSLPPGINTVTILGLLSRVAREREQYIHPILNLMMKYQVHSEGLAHSKLNSIGKSIRNNLVWIIRKKFNSIDWTDNLCQTLYNVGARHVVDRFKPIKIRPDEEENDSEVQALLLKDMPRQNPVSPQIQQHLQEVKNLPLGAVIQIVEAGIASLRFPPQLQPLELPGNNDQNTLVYLLASAISSNHRQKQVLRPPPPATQWTLPDAVWPPQTVPLKVEEKPAEQPMAIDGVTPPKTQTNNRPELDNVEQRGEKRTRALIENAQVFTPRKRLAVSQEGGDGAGDKPKVLNKSGVVLKAPPTQSNARIMNKYFLQAFDRMIQCELGVRDGGESQLRINILSHLATKFSIKENQHLIDHVAMVFPDTSLALQWLYCEWTNDHPDATKRYTITLKKIMEVYLPNAKKR